MALSVRPTSRARGADHACRLPAALPMRATSHVRTTSRLAHTSHFNAVCNLLCLCRQHRAPVLVSLCARASKLACRFPSAARPYASARKFACRLPIALRAHAKSHANTGVLAPVPVNLRGACQLRARISKFASWRRLGPCGQHRASVRASGRVRVGKFDCRLVLALPMWAASRARTGELALPCG